MNDTITVSNVCEHGFYDPHLVNYPLAPPAGPQSVPLERCAGGRRMVLQRTFLGDDVERRWDGRGVWMEMSNDGPA